MATLDQIVLCLQFASVGMRGGAQAQWCGVARPFVAPKLLADGCDGLTATWPIGPIAGEDALFKASPASLDTRCYSIGW